MRASSRRSHHSVDGRVTGERPPQHRAIGFQAEQRFVDIGDGDAQHGSQCRRRRRAENRQPAAQQFGERLGARPRARRSVRRCALIGRVEPCIRSDGEQFRQSLGGNPERDLLVSLGRGCQRRGVRSDRPRRQQEAARQQRIVQFVRIARVRHALRRARGRSPSASRTRVLDLPGSLARRVCTA